MRTTKRTSIDGITPLCCAQSSPRSHSSGLYIRNSQTVSSATPPRRPFSLETPRSSHHTTSNKQGQNNHNHNYLKKHINNGLSSFRHQKDEVHDILRGAVAKLLDFNKFTMPVWTRRVSALDARIRRLPVGDESFLERAAEKLSACLDELNDTLQMLSDSTQTPETSIRWKRYVQNSQESLLDIKTSVFALQSRIKKILSFATSTSPKTLDRVLYFMGANASPTKTRHTRTNTRPLHSRRTTDERGKGPRSNPSSTMGFSSYGSSSAGRRSDESLDELAAARSGSNHGTPVRTRRARQRSLTGSEGNSSHCESPKHSRSQEHHHHNHNHHSSSEQRPRPRPRPLAPLQQQKQQQQRSVLSALDRRHSWADILTQYSMRCSRTLSSPHRSPLLRKEPFYDSVEEYTRPTKFLSKEPIHDFRDNGINSNRRGSGLWDVGLTENECQHDVLYHSRSRDRSKQQLQPDERCRLLERIDILEKSFDSRNASSLKEAENLFNKLYGSRRGPRYYSEWIDDMEMRAVRHR
ncbi:uncharacterized protein TM35_000074040 [Trypanosoma theileri]|uniref:Uncharacterized protein n=1 Tax=Trypanosoma theileri TaxID=67003 RepID=A0A1X0P3I7_9TRYP|nr:uncharacterized protein TM35_000074040 [Trypanosoma theileri]ORC90980.1 hypothetical protein TM35_000074040 [Trypanosoma theileri]